MKASISRDCVFTLELEVEPDKPFFVFFKQPSEAVVLSILPALREMYVKTQEVKDPSVIVTDWQYLVKDKVQANVLKNFMEKTTLTAKVLTNDLREITYNELRAELDEDTLTIIEGTIVFICASWRYIMPSRRATLLEDFNPLPSFTEAMSLCKSRLQDSQKGPDSTTNADQELVFSMQS